MDNTRYDIGVDDNNEIIFDNTGDIVFNESDESHVKDTINASPGWWKEYPMDGVGIMNYLGSSGRQQLLARKAQIELNSDGYQVGTPIINISTESITINPDASRV